MYTYMAVLYKCILTVKQAPDECITQLIFMGNNYQGCKQFNYHITGQLS